MFLRGRGKQIIGGNNDDGINWKKLVLLNVELLKQSVQRLIVILKIRVYYEGEKKWNRSGFKRTWHSTIRT